MPPVVGIRRRIQNQKDNCKGRGSCSHRDSLNFVGQRHFFRNSNPKRKRGKELGTIPRSRFGLQKRSVSAKTGAVQLVKLLSEPLEGGMLSEVQQKVIHTSIRYSNATHCLNRKTLGPNWATLRIARPGERSFLHPEEHQLHIGLVLRILSILAAFSMDHACFDPVDVLRFDFRSVSCATLPVAHR